MPSSLASQWSLEPELDFLNHGSYGAVPIAVLEKQAEMRAVMERQPVHFMVRELQPLLDEAMASIGVFVCAPPEDLAPVANATSGVNAVLRSLRFEPGDELIVTSHVYPACKAALDFVATRWGGRVVVVDIPRVPASAEAVVDHIMAAATHRSVLALVSHVTSPTALVFPAREIVKALQGRGIDVLVDGAHAPGMVDVDLTSMGAAYYAANCHKWMGAPKGAGFLYVRPDKQDHVFPAVISHGYAEVSSDRSRFRQMFDWVGTDDPTALLCAPTAIDVMGRMVPGGWAEVRRRNHRLAVDAAGVLAACLGLDAPGLLPPESMIGSMVALPIGDGGNETGRPDPLYERLIEHYRIEVPIVTWPGQPHRLVRLSAQLYNHPAQYERLGAALRSEAA